VPELVAEVRGIFHVHTTWSDGAATITDMARAARDAGFAYAGITEHSKTASYAGGLDATQLARQARAIARARREVPGFAILHGVEVDVLPDGSLDLDDATLASLDFVIASVHARLDMRDDEMTARLLRAVSHPLVTILGHPTGRLLLGRKGSSFDIEAVAAAAAANDTFLEINANPQRLDLSEDLVRRAAARGASFAIDPDAHSPRGVRDTALGVSVARRAGLAASQVLNTRGATEVAAYLATRRRKAKRALALA
jgi:DNA polymerase (family 10)